VPDSVERNFLHSPFTIIDHGHITKEMMVRKVKLALGATQAPVAANLLSLLALAALGQHER
jgi:hypothetical protein